MNPVTRDDAIRMVQTVEKLHDAVGQFINECGLQPSPDSQAVSELNTFQRPESLRTAYSQGTVLINVAADRLSDPRGSVILYDRVSSRDKTLKLYDDFCHEIFNEPGREQVFADMEAWLLAHI